MRSLSRTKKSSQQNFLLIFQDGMLCMFCSTITQRTIGIQQRLLVLEIVSCWNLTRIRAKRIELTTMICNFAILISCSNTTHPNLFFNWWWEKITGLLRLIRYYFVWSDTLKRDMEKGSGTTALFRLFNINLLMLFVNR